MTKSMNRRLSQSSLKNANHKARDLRMESLEERQLLSVSPVSAASDDVDYACIAPAEMVPMESAPVVEMNLTDQVPTLDAPVALGAELPDDGNFCGYHFEGVNATFDVNDDTSTITISGSGTVTVSGTSSSVVNIICNNAETDAVTLEVETMLATGSTVTMNNGGTLNIDQNCIVPSVTASSDIEITGSGTVTATSGSGALTVSGGTVGTVDGSTSITVTGTGAVEAVNLVAGETTSINATTIATVNGVNGSVVQGSGTIHELKLATGGSITVSGSNTMTIDQTTGDGDLHVAGGTVTAAQGSGAVSIESGSIGTVTNASGFSSTGGTINTVTISGTTSVNGGTVTTVNGSGAVSIESGSIGTVTNTTNTNGVNCSGGSIGTVTIKGKTEVSNGHIDSVTGTGETKITGGSIGSVTNASSVESSGGRIDTVDITGTTTVNHGDENVTWNIGEVKGSGSVVVTAGTIYEVNTSGATEITGGSIGTVTNTSTTNGVVCSGGQIGTVTIAGKTTVNGDNGIITTVNGTGATEISKGKIGTVENASSIKVTGGEITTSASTTGLVDISDGKIETVASAGSVKVTGGEITNSVTATGAVTVSDGLIGSVTSASSVSISRGSIGEISNTCAGTVGISGGTITTASSSGTITVDGGTITHVTSSATSPVIINGTTNADTIAVGQTVTIGSTSVTFDSGAVADVTINAGGGNDEITVTADPTSGALTINGGEGDDYIAVSADSNSGTLTINGEAGNDVIITGGLEATVDGQGNSDLIIAGKFTGNAATLKTWDGDAAKALAWSLDGTLSSSTVAAASASAAVNGDSTDVLYYNTTGAAPTVTGALALGLTTTSTTIIVTAENEADTSLSTITMAEAYAAMTATPGAYTLGFSHSEYIVNSALPVYANTTEANKLTIDGTHTYNAVSGAGTDGAVTLKVGDFTPDSGTAYMMVGAGTYVDLKGLTFTKNAGSQAIAGINVAGTLTLTGGAKVTNFKSHGIENVSVNTLIVEEGEISGNTGSGIYNTGTAIIGTQGSTDAAAVQIFNNGSNGITNTGGDASLTIHNVTIYGHTASGGLNGKGVNNTNGATATIKGATASAINIYGNRRGVDNYGDDDPANTILTINSAYIHNNTAAGVYNTDGIVTIGTQTTGVASDVLILNNLNGVVNAGEGDLTIYNATISANTGEGISNGSTDTDDTTVAKLTLDGNSANAILIGELKNGEEVVYEGNTLRGILNNARGKAEIKKATINGNKSGGIVNAGMLEIGTSTGGDAVNVQISANQGYGIENTSRGVVEEGVVTTPGLRVYNATIDNNTSDGIYNHGKGTVTVGVDGRTAADVQIYRNDHDGIDNDGEDSTLIVHNAEIFKNRTVYGGINNRNSAKAYLYGSTANAIYIHENYSYGIKNENNSTMTIGIEGTGKAENIVIEMNKTDGVQITGTGGNVTIFNATIQDNKEFGVDTKTGNSILNLYGNTTNDLYIYHNGYSGVNAEGPKSGNGAPTVNVTKALIDSNGYRTTTEDDGSKKNGGDGINIRVGKLTIGTYNEQTGKVGDAGDVVITKNTRYGVQNGQNSSNCELIIYNATIGGTEGAGNKNGGIYSHKGSVTIGTQGTGVAGDVIISGNIGDGIENDESTLIMYNGTIRDHEHPHMDIKNAYAINNKSGQVFLYGNETDAILLTKNYSGGIQNMNGQIVEGEAVKGQVTIKKATITENGSTEYTEPYNPAVGTKNWGHGIYNRDGILTIGDVNGNGSADDVVISKNARNGIENTTPNDGHGVNTVTVYNAKIDDNGMNGINNNGYMKLQGTVTTGANPKESIQIINNDEDGIHNLYDLITTSGYEIKNVYIANNADDGIENTSTGKLHVVSATIDSNDDDGIYNAGTVKVGIGGTEGSAADVTITNNGNDGIENATGGVLEVYDATISGNTVNGINNAGTATIEGTGVGAASTVQIEENPTGIYNTGALEVSNANIADNADYGINNAGGTATLEGSGAGATSTIQITGSETGILNSATLDITGANITGNTNIGIDNQNGVAKLKGSGTGTSSSVQVTGQPLGIYNTGAASNLEISGAYISTNTTNGVGIQNHGGNATLEGTTAAAVQVTGSKTGILNEYVNANQKGNLTITGASVSSNSAWGIDNQGGIVTIDGESVDKVLVNNNDAGGIRNANTTSLASTGTLSVSGATIQFNGDENTSTVDGDGIYNEGVATIGEGATVLIDRNQGDGIENSGVAADLTVKKATISTNGKNANAYDYGIYNHQGGTALLDGDSAAAIVIRDNGRSDDDALSGGIYNGTGSEFTIRKATITENHHHGIENDGIMFIGTQGNDHGKDEVLITNNLGDGIENKGASADLKVYNATISGSTNTINGQSHYGIDNHDGGKALLDGNTAAAIYITDNGQNDTDEMSGGIYNGTSSEFTIIKATVTENHHHGIENDGTMTIGTEPASGSTTVGAASDVQVTRNKGNGIDNDENGTLRIYNGNISQNDVGSHTESNININNGIRNDGTVVIGVEGSTEADAVTINENRGNGILNRKGGDVTVYNATLDGNTNDIHFRDDPNNNGIRNDSGAKLKLKGSLDSNGNESIRLTNNGEDGLFNAADLSAEGYEVEHIYAADNGSEGVEQSRIKSSDETPYMTILSGTIYHNGYGSTSDKYGFGIHVKRGTMNLKGADVSSINIYENYQSGIRVENDSVLNVEKATINQNGRNDNGDGIHASGTSQVTIGINGHAASEVLITNNKRSGIQIADTNTKLTVYNATISGNNGPRTDVPHHGINNKGQTELLGTGSGEDATIQILENGQHGIYNNYIIDQAQGLYIEGNGLRGIMNENSFTQTGAIDVVNNVGGGIDNTATGTYIQNAGTTLNVLNNKGAEDGGVYQGVDDDGAGIKNTGILTLDGTVTITGNVGIRNGGGLYQGGTLTNDLNETLTIQDNEATNGGGVYVAADTVIKNGDTESISGNTATANGGGIYVEAGKTLSTAGESNVKSNNAVNGAGIYNAGTLTFDDKVTIDGNTATGNGGGIYQGGVITNDLNEELFVTNNTAGNGGGVYVAAATTLKNGSTDTINHNSATNGGGIYVEAGKTLTFETSNITANTGTNGGGMYLAGTLKNSDGSAELTFQNNDTTAEGRGGALYIANGATYGPTNGTFTLNRQADFHFINNGHYTSETNATRGGAIYNAGTLHVANTNYGFGVSVSGAANGVKTRTVLTNEVNTGIGAAVYNAGTFTNASEYKAFHAGGIDTADATNPVDTKTYKTYSLYVTGQKGESAFASSGNTTLSNAKIYGNSTGGLRVDDGLTTLTQGTEIGSGAFILATTAYANYAEGFGTNTGYGVKVTGGSLQSNEASTYAQYTNKRKNTEFAGAARYEDYQVADAVQISGNGGTAIVVEGGNVYLNDMRAESNGGGLNVTSGGGFITNAVIEGTIARGGVTLVNTTIPGVAETDTTNNIAGENASGNRFVVDELGNTYTLNSDFDAIDKGNNDNAVYHFADGTTRTIKHDLGGHDRILNGTVDLGAFECPISWITNTMFIDDIKYAVEHCAPVAFGGKVKFDINCNGKVFYWDEDPRALNPPSVHNVAPIITYVDKDTILDARYEDADGNYYWMDIVMDFGNYSTGFGIYYSDVTFNVYGLTVVATNGGTSKNGSAFYVPELRKGGSVVNLYGVSCYDCTAAYGGAIYGETNAVINVYTDVTAAGYVKGSSTTYVVGGKTHYQPANDQAKVSQADTYRACVFEGNTGTYGGVIYSNNKRASTVIGGVEYTTGLNLVGVDLTGKTYISTGRVAHSEVTPVDKLQYDLTTEERGEGTDAVRQYSAQFINNKASRRGGAINLVGKGNVEGVSFIDNYTGYGNSPLGGGAIYVEGNGNMALKNADFIENSSKVDGGAMVVRGKLTSDGNLVFAGNSAPYIEHGTSGTRDGGAIYCYGGNMNLKADVVTETRALFKDQKLTTVGGYGSEFLNNEANFGGAVEIQSGTLNFTKALFQRNKASVGGALYNETPFANVTVDAGTRFLQNYASRFAGAVYNNAGSFTSAAEYKNNWAANEGALYSVYEEGIDFYEEGIDLGKLSNNYAIGDNTQYLYYNYWMDSYDGQEARQKVGKKMPVEVKYFGVAGLNTATESSLEPASAGFAGITSSPNSTQALGSVSEWNNIYAVVTLKESTVAGETMVQELDIDTNVFQVAALSVAEGWEGEVSVTDDAKVILTLTATSDCENVGENIASLKVLAPEEGLAQDTSVMGVEVTKMSCYDIVKDNRIDIQDLVAFARNFGSDNSIADFNDDARVDIQDLVAFARNFGKVNEVSDAEPLALAAKPEDIPQTIASQPVIPAQGALLETVEEKEESNAAALAAALPPVESQTQACDFIFANDDDEDDDWLDDICEKKDQEVQNLLIDDLFGKN